ncbi:MAG: phosphate-starvation-inducible PsiE family protein [Clostridium sp.]
MHKINMKLVKLMKIVEILIAIILMGAVLVSTLAMVVYGIDSMSTHTFQLNDVLERALTIVVGIEFIKMLILHTPQSVIEVLMYAVARQIIISHDSALENLYGVLAVLLIFLIEKYFLSNKKD